MEVTLKMVPDSTAKAGGENNEPVLKTEWEGEQQWVKIPNGAIFWSSKVRARCFRTRERLSAASSFKRSTPFSTLALYRNEAV